MHTHIPIVIMTMLSMKPNPIIGTAADTKRIFCDVFAPHRAHQRHRLHRSARASTLPPRRSGVRTHAARTGACAPRTGARKRACVCTRICADVRHPRGARQQKGATRGQAKRRVAQLTREPTFCSWVRGAGDLASGAFSSTARACRAPQREHGVRPRARPPAPARAHAHAPTRPHAPPAHSEETRRAP